MLLIVNLTEFDNIKSARMAVQTESLENVAYFDVNGHFGKEFNIIGVPTAFYINSEGIISNISHGADTADGILSKLKEITE